MKWKLILILFLLHSLIGIFDHFFQLKSMTFSIIYFIGSHFQYEYLARRTKLIMPNKREADKILTYYQNDISNWSFCNELALNFNSCSEYSLGVKPHLS